MTAVDDQARPAGRHSARHGGGQGAGHDGPTERAEHGPRLGGLVAAELQRFGARRFVRWLLVLALLGYAVVVPLVVWTQFSRTTPEVLAEARARVDQIVADQARFREQCLAAPLPPDVPEGTTVEEFCGPPANPADFRVEDFMPKRPFVLADAHGPGALAVGVATAALFFVVGATWVGAEWSARTMTALLFWETRRLRVLAVKAGVLALVAAAAAAVMQAVWAGSAWAAASLRGRTGPLPDGFWPDAAALGGRVALLVVLTALLGFAVAHLVRSTGASLGVGFVYFAVVESAVQAVRPAWSQWLLTTNAAALVLEGGTRIYVPGTTVDSENGQVVEFTEKVVSNLHGGLVVGGATAALLLLGGWLFRRRDIA